MAIEVKLLSHSPDPIRSLYIAYRVAYSALTPMQIVERIEADKITEQEMLRFINERLETGHGSPLEQVWFEFGISGVSRAFSHQFVRHHIGISFEQQSQRYVTYKKGKEFPYTMPDTVKRFGWEIRYRLMMQEIDTFYHDMVETGVPAEDARFILPNATNTNFKINVNYLELLHIGDLRLCTRAQWEFRHVMGKMRGEVNRAFPWLGVKMQPKCGAHRLGYCDETLADWAACPFSKSRPHKSQVIPK